MYLFMKKLFKSGILWKFSFVLTGIDFTSCNFVLQFVLSVLPLLCLNEVFVGLITSVGDGKAFCSVTDHVILCLLF